MTPLPTGATFGKSGFGHAARPLDRRGLALRLSLAFAGLVAATSLFLAARSIRPSRALPVYGRVPRMHLVDARGAPFDQSSMLGHVSVVDFIFTRCSSSCPRLTTTMRLLQARLAANASRAKLVSFSVDPENDTPSVLADYAARAQADGARWSFVTGPPDDITRVVVSGFKVAATKIAQGAGDYDVTHGDWFVLVDGQLQIRGYYATDEPGALDTLVEDIRDLDRERTVPPQGERPS